MSETARICSSNLIVMVKCLENQRTYLTRLAVYVAFNIVLRFKSVNISVRRNLLWDISCCPVKDIVTHRSSSERRLNTIVNTRNCANVFLHPRCLFPPHTNLLWIEPRCLKMFLCFYCSLLNLRGNWWVCVGTEVWSSTYALLSLKSQKSRMSKSDFFILACLNSSVFSNFLSSIQIAAIWTVGFVLIRCVYPDYLFTCGEKIYIFIQVFFSQKLYYKTILCLYWFCRAI